MEIFPGWQAQEPGLGWMFGLGNLLSGVCLCNKLDLGSVNGSQMTHIIGIEWMNQAHIDNNQPIPA